MKRWNQWTLKYEDGWAERRRRFQKLFAETFEAGTPKKVPVVAGASAPNTRVAGRNRGGQ
jgi:hypothetical protein